MMIFNELTEENLLLYAAKAYYKPNFSDIEEFHEDLKRFKYIKRLVNRYLEHEELSERLILNHLIVIFNSLLSKTIINFGRNNIELGSFRSSFFFFIEMFST